MSYIYVNAFYQDWQAHTGIWGPTPSLTDDQFRYQLERLHDWYQHLDRTDRERLDYLDLAHLLHDPDLHNKYNKHEVDDLIRELCAGRLSWSLASFMQQVERSQQAADLFMSQRH